MMPIIRRSSQQRQPWSRVRVVGFLGSLAAASGNYRVAELAMSELLAIVSSREPAARETLS